MIDVSGAALLNLGCGYKTTDASGVVNIDFGVFQRIAASSALRRAAPLIVGASRADRFKKLATNIAVHDIAKGIPARDNSVAAVYHSHVLEHLDRDVAADFMREVHRVLRPGGIHRVAVPDLEFAVRAYLTNLDEGGADHDNYVAALLEQSVRREAMGTSTQARGRRIIENVILGDARRRGETHQWMYDFRNLGHLLKSTGFTDVRRRTFSDSAIPGWTRYGLEVDENGDEYKPHSLYMEAVA